MPRLTPLLLPFVVLAYAACGKEGSADPAPNGPPVVTGAADVYVVGSEQEEGVGVAKLWTNGQETVLGTGAENSGALDVFVASSGVYVVGYHQVLVDNELRFRKDLWVNGVAQSLIFDTIYGGMTADTGSVHYAADDIAVGVHVDAGDVYILVNRNVVVTELGQTLSDVDYVYYLKNEEPFGLGVGRASDFTVANGLVHVCGHIGNRAVHWNNGSVNYLTDGSSEADARAIAVEGSNVHVAGREMEGGQSKAKYWLNGNATTLTTGTNQEFAYGLSVSGTDVYIAGTEWTAPGHAKAAAKLWKNGVAQYLTDGLSTIAEAHAVAVNGADVHAVGTEHIILGSYDDIKVWLNGAATTLNDQGDVTDQRTAIVVVPL